LAWCFSTALGLPAWRASFLRSARSARRSAMECSMTVRLTLPARTLKFAPVGPRGGKRSGRHRKKPRLNRENTPGKSSGVRRLGSRPTGRGAEECCSPKGQNDPEAPCATSGRPAPPPHRPVLAPSPHRLRWGRGAARIQWPLRRRREAGRRSVRPGGRPRLSEPQAAAIIESLPCAASAGAPAPGTGPPVGFTFLISER